MKKVSLLVALLLLAVAVAPPALAGEVKGPPGEGGAEGGTTPIDGFWTGDGAASICSFSGLNDEVNAQEPTSTQSYGIFLVLIKEFLGISAKEAMEVLGESPGHECNPSTAPWGNPKKNAK